MKSFFKHPAIIVLGVFVVAVIGCSLGCTIAMRLAMRGHDASYPQHGETVPAHVWLHETLVLEAEQISDLKQIENHFLDRKSALEGSIAEANAKLAAALKEDQAYSPRVEAAVDEIHRAQAQLQKATVEQIVEMKTILTPDQFEQLLEMAANALGG